MSKTDRLDNLFIVFTGIYRQKWTAGLEDEATESATIQAWKYGIDDLTDEEINYALEKCLLTFDWAPSIAEFRRLALKIPTPSAAYAMGKSEHPAVTKAWNMIGDDWGIGHMSGDMMRKLFFAAYKDVVEDILYKGM